MVGRRRTLPEANTGDWSRRDAQHKKKRLPARAPCVCGLLRWRRDGSGRVHVAVDRWMVPAAEACSAAVRGHETAPYRSSRLHHTIVFRIRTSKRSDLCRRALLESSGGSPLLRILAFLVDSDTLAGRDKLSKIFTGSRPGDSRSSPVGSLTVISHSTLSKPRRLTFAIE